eukprot:m.15479 g.15479  ORF g.15479 m.15479 type:complete len:533 (+) comp5417_c0_seq1:150-1748(+)
MSARIFLVSASFIAGFAFTFMTMQVLKTNDINGPMTSLDIDPITRDSSSTPLPLASKYNERISTIPNVEKKDVKLSSVVYIVKTSTTSPKYIARLGRVQGILNTWFKLAEKQVWFVTDIYNKYLDEISGGHLINTSCPTGHKKEDLCCKLEHEFGHFYNLRHKSVDKSAQYPQWMCHVDDDMYIFPRNIEKRLSRLNASEFHFVGPSNMWPDETLHFTKDEPKGSLNTDLHHPCNGIYCVSGALVDAIYPEYLSNSKLTSLCTATPDDVTITDVIYNHIGVRLTVENGFHHQHSKNYKLPFFNPSVLTNNALSLYGYENLPYLHDILYNSSDRDPWWSRLMNLKTLPPRGKRQVHLGLNFCRHTHTPPINQQSTNNTSKENMLYNFCGPYSDSRNGGVLQSKAAEPLCESRETYKKLHASHEHTQSLDLDCPYSNTWMHQFFGIARHLDNEEMARLRKALHPTQIDDPSWPQWQHSSSADKEVWVGLAKRLAEAKIPGTCCVSNPNIAKEEGGDCYWTAYDQASCTDTHKGV